MNASRTENIFLQNNTDSCLVLEKRFILQEKTNPRKCVRKLTQHLRTIYFLEYKLLLLLYNAHENKFYKSDDKILFFQNLHVLFIT